MENQSILNYVSLEDTLAIQKISNLPSNETIERYVVVYGVDIKAGSVKRMTMQYSIIHITNGQLVNVQPINKPDWVINNIKKVFVRDGSGEPMLNPDYVPVYSQPTYSEEVKDEQGNIIQESELIDEGGVHINADEEYLKEYGFKYFKDIAWDNASVLSKRQQFQFYIMNLDQEDKFFDFY